MYYRFVRLCECSFIIGSFDYLSVRVPLFVRLFECSCIVGSFDCLSVHVSLVRSTI